jgi:hypothetical protein
MRLNDTTTSSDEVGGVETAVGDVLVAVGRPTVTEKVVVVVGRRAGGLDVTMLTDRDVVEGIDAE